MKQTTRGVGADIIVHDEAAFSPPGLFFSVIVPILQMKNTCYFALSSPQGNDNYYSKLLNLKIDGKPFFRICQCAMICDECRKLEREKQIFCNHVKEQPHWLSSKKGNRLKKLYLADPATAIKEFGGVIEDKFVPCFPKHFLSDMFNGPTYKTESAPEYIFITVDPSGGGISQLAVCSGFYDDDLNFVVSFYWSHYILYSYSFFKIFKHFNNVVYIVWLL